MRRWWRLRSLALALCSVGCASPRAQSQPADTTIGTGADSLASVRLERGSCRGNCPSYIVSLASDGLVRFTGLRAVRPIGTDSARVSRSAVAALRTAFAIRQFARVPSTIEYGTPACGSYVADLPTHILALRSASGEHRVTYDEGCRNHPMLLDTLVRMVDSISGSARWTLPPNR